MRDRCLVDHVLASKGLQGKTPLPSGGDKRKIWRRENQRRFMDLGICLSLPVKHSYTMWVLWWPLAPSYGQLTGVQPPGQRKAGQFGTCR